MTISRYRRIEIEGVKLSLIQGYMNIKIVKRAISDIINSPKKVYKERLASWVAQCY